MSENQKNIQRGLIGLILAMALMIPVVIYLNHRQEETVQPMTQEQVEHAGNVQQAAKASGVSIDDDQAEETAKKIKWIHDNAAEPEAIEYASGNDWKDVSESARKKSGADYAVVTASDGSKPAEIKNDSAVQLNQYNVQAYKKTIRSIEYDPINKEADIVVQRKITDSGHYVGIGGGYNFSENKVVAKIVYSW